MARCIIFTAGDAGSLTKESLLLQPGDYIICCDAGYRLAQAWGIHPDLLVGDFDSYTGALPSDLPVRRFVRDKDDTDTLIAVHAALERGCDELVLVAATGGRLDHTLGNLQILAGIAHETPAVRARILGGWEQVYLLQNGSLTLRGEPGQTFSVLCHSDAADGVSISGAVFPLERARLTNDRPLGISNRMGEAGEATVTVEQGILFVLVPAPETI